MGKALSIISLVFGLVSLALSPLSYFIGSPTMLVLYFAAILGMASAGIVCGGIGISKSDLRGMAIAGLVLSCIAMVNTIAGFTMQVTGLIY